MKKRRKRKSHFKIYFIAAAIILWLLVLFTPLNFTGIFFGKYSISEQFYLLSLRLKYSGTQRVLSESKANEIIQNALVFLDSNTSSKIQNSPDAQALLFGTACAETRLKPRFQDYGGSAIGLFQIEFLTFKDLWQRAIKKNNPLLYAAIKKKYSKRKDGEITFEDLQKSDELCAVFARIKYAQIKEPIPSANNPKAQARYYKKYYNTYLGKASESGYLKAIAEVQRQGTALHEFFDTTQN